MERVFLGLAGLLLGISLGLRPQDISRSNPASPRKTPSIPPLLLGLTHYATRHYDTRHVSTCHNTALLQKYILSNIQHVKYTSRQIYTTSNIHHVKYTFLEKTLNKPVLLCIINALNLLWNQDKRYTLYYIFFVDFDNTNLG